MSHQRISINSKIANGEPIISGTQVSVSKILSYCAKGLSPQEIVNTLPELVLADVSAALEYAAEIVPQQTDSLFDQPTEITQAETTGSLAKLDLNKILVVDDTPMNLKLMVAMFARSEFELVLAYDGLEGWEKTQSEAPFLVLSDIQMPRMSGLELCQKIKTDSRTQDVAVILVTAHARGAKEVSEGLNIGADDFISRPFERQELLARVRALTRLKRAELEAQYQAQLVARRNKGLELLNELAISVASSLDLQEIFTQSVQKLSQLLKAKAVSMVFVNEETQELIVNIASHTGQVISTPTDITVSAQSIESVIKDDVPSLISKLLHKFQNKLTVEPPNSLEAITSVAMISKEKIIGSIAIINKEGGNKFSEVEWALLISAVSIVAVAVENARLFTEVQEFNRHLEQKVQERTRELASEKKKIEAILVSMADGVLVLDAEDCILTANVTAQTILDVNLNEVVGMPIFSERFNSPLWLFLRNLINTPDLTTGTSTDIPDLTHPGALLSIQANSAKVRTENGETLGTVIVLSDITTIIGVERMKARFMAGVTHELKTPLAVVKVNANNLARFYKRLPEEKREKLVNSILDQTKQLERLVDDILDLAHFDSSVIKLNLETVNLGALIDEIVTEMSPLAQEKKLTFYWNKPTPDITIEADTKKLGRAINNLINNAIKYTLQGSVTVKVEADIIGNKVFAVMIYITDTGIGIPPKDHERIFDRFYRVDTSHTIPGTGLGLSIVKEIVTAHKGKVEVNNPPNGGSQFIITLPGS